MPIIKSAKKRVRVAKKAALRNRTTKRTLKGALKIFAANATITTGKKASDAHAAAQSAIDTAVKKGLLHKNKAARKKRQLAVAAKKAGVKLVGTKSAPKKPVPKTTKPAAKKTPAKKTTAKK